MNKQELADRINKDIGNIPAISDHEHHLPDSFFFSKVTLDSLIQNSYISWMGYSPEFHQNWRAKLLEEGRFNSYFQNFEKGLQKVHSIDLPITSENWNRISDIVSSNYQDLNFHWKTLIANGYKRIILDCYWDPGDDDGHNELFVPTFRIDKFMYGYHSTAVAPNEIIPWEKYNFTGGSLDDYVDNMINIIRSRWEAGKVVALKCAEAYNRSISFLPDNKTAAEASFGIPPDKIDQPQWISFGNYIFNRCCELASELDVPFQIHTGLGSLSGSNPLLLEPIIAKYPKTRFVLFHSGFPWTLEVAALAHNYANVLPSLTWTGMISPSVAERTLDEYIDIARTVADITWGSDCWVPEESVGALQGWKSIISNVIAKRLLDRRINFQDVEVLARKLLYENNQKIYRIY